jgi:hypothetical protein
VWQIVTMGQEAARKGTEAIGGTRVLTSHQRTLGLLAKGKNINPETLLATDYLNHFNEIIMLLEMVPSMPECFEDVRAWAPKSYQDHFRDSGFADKDLAILAYENAPARFRGPFDATIAQMDALVADGLANIEGAIRAGESGLVEALVSNLSRNLQKFVDVASAIIHGDERTMDQNEIDSILNR